MNNTKSEDVKILYKKVILNYAAHFGVTHTCKEFNVVRSTFYRWKNKFTKYGEDGLKRKTSAAHSHPKKTSLEVVEKILSIRKAFQLGPERIMWYLERYHGICISESTVYRILKRHNVNLLPNSAPKRAIHTKRYSKKVPGHHVQVDVKFLIFKSGDRKIKRFQYTAIDDATRIRALKIYQHHTQKNAIEFIKYVVEKFPFRINTIRTDRGHEFQAQFHWYVEDQGMKHVYIKPRSPQLNGKVERSHRSDQEEFYQLLTYKGDVNLTNKLSKWEEFYNFHRPHGAFNGNTPYEALRELLN